MTIRTLCENEIDRVHGGGSVTINDYNNGDGTLTREIIITGDDGSVRVSYRVMRIGDTIA